METIKSKRRWMMTKVLMTTVIGAFMALSGIALVGVDVQQLVIAYGTFVTFSAAIIATNLATKVGDDVT